MLSFNLFSCWNQFAKAYRIFSTIFFHNLFEICRKIQSNYLHSAQTRLYVCLIGIIAIQCTFLPELLISFWSDFFQCGFKVVSLLWDILLFESPTFKKISTTAPGILFMSFWVKCHTNWLCTTPNSKTAYTSLITLFEELKMKEGYMYVCIAW